MGSLFRIRNDSGIEFWCAFWCVSDFSVLYMISGSDFFFFFSYGQLLQGGGMSPGYGCHLI